MVFSQNFGQLSAKEQESLGLPPGYKVFSPFPFGGMNQSDSRQGMEDSEFYFLENFIKLGNGNLRTIWDKGPAVYTSPSAKTIVNFYSFNIGMQQYFVVFLSDGTAVQINADTFAQTVISSVLNTFYETGFQLTASAQWGSLYLLMVNNITPDSYYVWDGSVLFSAGTLGPSVTITDSGSGYSSNPTVTAFGGSGTGATFTATQVSGSVVSVKITNPGTGYRPGDIVQLAFSGGGSDNSAILQAVLSSNTVGHVSLLDGGSGYTSAPSVVFTGGGGSGAIANATLSPTDVASINIAAGGSGYTSPPSVIITGGGGTGATATATISAGSVDTITINNPGSGYTSSPGVVLSGGGGSGYLVAAVLSPTSVASIILTNGGSGYTGTPSVSLSGGGGSGATALAVLNPGSVDSVTVIDGGTGYNSTPTLTFVGGGGTGAAATAIVAGGVITSVMVTAGGTDYTSAPSVQVQSGVNNSASATATLMPFGVSGSSIETFQQRVWLPFPNQQGSQVNGGTFLVSAPGSLTDFSTADGGLIFTTTDSLLRAQYTNIKQSNGYLYPFGDSSVSVISGVTTSGNPATTTFNYQNTDPQIGTSWRDSCQDYSRTILFANPLGVYGLYGGAVTKISQKIDDIFINAIFPPTAGALTPCAAIVNLFNMKLYLLLITIRDPLTFANRTVMLAWDEKQWYVFSQSTDLTYIGTQEVNSNLASWGTNGTTLFQLFTTPSTGLIKTISTKLYGANASIIVKAAMGFYMQAQDLSSDASGISLVTATTDSELGAFALPNPVSFVSPPPTYNMYATGSGDIYGVNLGMTIASTSKDFMLTYLGLGYIDASSVFGNSPIAGTLEE